MSLKELRTARREGRPLPVRQPRPAFWIGKPGTCLKIIMGAEFGIQPCDACHKLAEEMDQMGVAACREQLDDLAVRLGENAKHLSKQRSSWRSLAEAAARHPVQAIKVATGLADGLYKELILRACDKAEGVE